MWDRFFESVDGCGPLMAAVCISYLDMSRKALVDAVYLDKDGNVQMRKSIGYNDFLHTKLLGDSFVKRSGSEYKNMADWKNDKGEVSAMRCHRVAIRQAHLGMAPHGYNEADMRPAK